MPPDPHRNTLKESFRTIRSPVFSDLVLVLLWSERDSLLLDDTLFEALRTMYEVRPFKLVFLFQVWFPPSEDGQQMFEGVIESVNAKGFLKFLDSPPTFRVERL